MPDDDSEITRIDGSSRLDKHLLPQRQRHATHQASIEWPPCNPDGEHGIDNPTPQGYRDGKRQKKGRDRHENVGHDPDNGLYSTPPISTDRPQGDTNQHRQPCDHHSDHHRGPGSIHDATKNIPSHLIRTEPMFPARGVETVGDIHACPHVLRKGDYPGTKKGRKENQGYDAHPNDRQRILLEEVPAISKVHLV